MSSNEQGEGGTYLMGRMAKGGVGSVLCGIWRGISTALLCENPTLRDRVPKYIRSWYECQAVQSESSGHQHRRGVRDGKASGGPL